MFQCDVEAEWEALKKIKEGDIEVYIIQTKRGD